MKNGLNCPNRRGIYGPIVTEECDHRPKECSKVSSNLELSHDYKELLPTTRCEYEERPDQRECLSPPYAIPWIIIIWTSAVLISGYELILQIVLSINQTNIDNILNSLDMGVPW